MEIKREVPSREIFTQSLAAWMVNQDMILGTAPEEIDLFASVKLMKTVVKIFHKLGNITPVFISGGAKADKVKRVLDPFVKLSDLVGLKIPEGVVESQQLIIPVIYADSLTPKDVDERFDLFVELAPSVANLGMRFNFQNQGLYIFPLLIYFDSKKYAQHSQKILQSGWRRKLWKKIYLRAHAVDLSHKKVELAEMQGISKSAAKVFNNIGIKSAWEKFHPEDLDMVLLLAEKLEAASTESDAG